MIDGKKSWGMIFDAEVVGPWVMDRIQGTWITGLGTAIGLLEFDKEGKTCKLIAGVVYESFNGRNIVAHIAGIEGKRWLTRDFLWYIFYYPFEQLQVRRITAITGSTNYPAQKFLQHIGFTLEATLKEANPSGDSLVYRIFREDCKWLTLTSKQTLRENEYGRQRREGRGFNSHTTRPNSSRESTTSNQQPECEQSLGESSYDCQPRRYLH